MWQKLGASRQWVSPHRLTDWRRRDRPAPAKRGTVNSHWRRNLIFTGLVVLLAAVLIVIFTAADPLCWNRKCERINEFRASHDRPGLEQRAKLQAKADEYADQLASTQILKHAACWEGPDPTCHGAEIIGFGPDYKTILNAWKRSSCKPWGTYTGPCPGHREILLDRDFTRVGIGIKVDALGTMWAVVRFK